MLCFETSTCLNKVLVFIKLPFFFFFSWRIISLKDSTNVQPWPFPKAKKSLWVIHNMVANLTTAHAVSSSDSQAYGEV